MNYKNIVEKCNKLFDSRDTKYPQGVYRYTERMEFLFGRLITYLNDKIAPKDTRVTLNISDKEYKYLFDNIERAIEQLNRIYTLARNGNDIEAINTLYEFYFNEQKEFLNIIKLPKDSRLFRMRSPQGENSLKHCSAYKEKDMWHIPFEKEFLVKNERYSISGFPCLYLGTSLVGCWEEIGRPSFEDSTCALFQNRNDCNILNMKLCIGNEELNRSKLRALIRLPLLIACSMNVEHPNQAFIPEYVIPCLLMKCILKYNKENEDPIRGVLYSSTKYRNEEVYYKGKMHEKIYENYVFPVNEIGKEGLCPILLSLFDEVASSSYRECKLKDSDFKNLVRDKSKEDEYLKSQFAAMEAWLPRSVMPTYSNLGGAIL